MRGIFQSTSSSRVICLCRSPNLLCDYLPTIFTFMLEAVAFVMSYRNFQKLYKFVWLSTCAGIRSSTARRFDWGASRLLLSKAVVCFLFVNSHLSLINSPLDSHKGTFSHDVSSYPAFLRLVQW